MYKLICENHRNDYCFANWTKYFTKISTAKKYVEHIRGKTKWYAQVGGDRCTDTKLGILYRIEKIMPESENFVEKDEQSICTTTLPPDDY